MLVSDERKGDENIAATGLQLLAVVTDRKC